jgi:hypothetical protein
MVTLEKIVFAELKQIVQDVFKNDIPLIEKYHLVNGDLKEAVLSTLVNILENTEFLELEYYKVMVGDVIGGYLCISRTDKIRMLYSFAIDVRFRNRDVHRDWWNEIQKLMGGSFKAGLWTKNERAIEFLQKCGMYVLEKRDDYIILQTS